MARSRYRDEDDEEEDEEDERPSRRGRRSIRRDDDEDEDDEEEERPSRRRGSSRAVGFRCPYCDTDETPTRRKKVSSGGWVMFVVLIFLCLPLCWLGLLMTEDTKVCSDCGIKLG